MREEYYALNGKEYHLWKNIICEEILCEKEYYVRSNVMIYMRRNRPTVNKIIRSIAYIAYIT